MHLFAPWSPLPARGSLRVSFSPVIGPQRRGLLVAVSF